MHARVFKECRALAPTWVVALLVVLAPILIWPLTRDSDSVLVVATFGFGLSAALLSVASFGKEFAQGTYGLLLAQPISRWRLWWEKTLVLGAALGTALLVFVGTVLVFVHVRNPYTGPFANTPAGELVLVGALLAGAAYGGGLFLTLLLRQANGAFWLAIFFPAAVCLGAGWLAHALWGEETDTGWTMIVTLVLYAVATYGVGLRLFLKREDVPWLAGDVTIPLVAPSWLVGGTEAARPGRRFGALRALLYKELHLQEVNLLGSLLFFALFVGVALAKRSDAKIGGIPLGEILLGLYFLIWILLPFLIGAVSIGEERRLGLLEWQQSLPVSRRRQFLAKLLSAYALSALLTGLLPWVLDLLGYLWTGDSVTGVVKMVLDTNPGPLAHSGFWVMVGVFALAGVTATTAGVFASSLARNLLQALSLIVELVAAIWVLASLFLLVYSGWSPVPLPLLGLVGLPILLVVLGWSAFRNYVEAVPGARLWLRNLAVVGLTCGCIFGITAAIYARAWEVIMPGPGLSSFRVTGPAAPRIVAQLLPCSVLLPDGTLWEWGPHPPFEQRPEQIGPPGAWRDVASSVMRGKEKGIQVVGLKPDGTLWRWRFAWSGDDYRRQTEPAPLGTEHNWEAIAGGGVHFLALKTDGSLWAWGINDAGELGDGTTADRDQPVRIGSDTNWLQVAAGWGTSLAVKTDGTLWEWGRVNEPGTVVQSGPRQLRACTSPRRVGEGTNWLRACVCASGDNGSLAIQKDGSLWVWGHLKPQPPGLPPFAVQGPTRLGQDRDWQSVTGWYGYLMVGLKNDGSLWWWRHPRAGEFPPIEPDQVRFRCKSSQKSWLAVGALGSMEALALAADGSLWIWGDEAAEREPTRLIPPTQRLRLVARLARSASR